MYEEEDTGKECEEEVQKDQDDTTEEVADRDEVAGTTEPKTEE